MINQLMIALDTPSLETAEQIILNTREYCSIYKVGLELFSSHGPKAIELVKKMNADVFLDLKLHDIPNTVAKTIKQIIDYDVRFLTLHALAGPIVLEKAAEEVALHHSKLTLLAVSVLTHHSDTELKAMGFSQSTSELVASLLSMAFQSGIRGAVCSPHEAALVKESFGKDITIVCPGIRPSGSATNDQTRIATPSIAIHSGADYLVIGRPITESADMKTAAALVAKEIKESYHAKTPS